MSFEANIDQAVAILEALERLSPRDEKGEYVLPYRGWIRRLQGDIAMARKWKPANRFLMNYKGKGEKDG